MTSASVLLYEGRVDNRGQIGDVLGRPELADAPDGSVLAAAYHAWGPNLSAKVIGEYAFAIVDLQNRRLVAGQDALGVRRVWYCHRDGHTWITSNLTLLFEQFPEVRQGFDRAVFPEYFAGLMSPWSGRTIWRGIRELGRGNVLVQEGAALHERAAWRPDSSRRLRFQSSDQLDEAFRQLLFDGVRHSLRSSGGVLCDLSGGYDSSTTSSVAALLARTAERPHAIVGWSTVSKRSSHELRLQDSVCATHRFDLHRLRIEDHLPFQAFDRFPLPIGGFIQTGAMYGAMREFARSRGLTARITGHGADALLQKGTCAPVYLAEWLREGRLADWANHVRQYLKAGTFSAWHLLTQSSIGTLDPLVGHFRQQPPEWLTARFRGEMRDANREFLERTERAFPSDARERLYRFTLSFIPFPGQLLPDERMPLLYRPLVEFLLALDWKDVTRPGESRLIMRRALRGVLPEPVRTGKADGQHSASLLEGLQRAWPRISHLISGEHLAQLGIVERTAFRRAVETLRAGYNGQQHQCLITAVYLELWLSLEARFTSSGGPLSDAA